MRLNYAAKTDLLQTRAPFRRLNGLRVATNYHLWYVGVWALTLLLYSFGWSRLNAPLDHELAFFFAVTITTSAVLALLHHLREPSVVLSDGGVRAAVGSFIARWSGTALLWVGFLLDFAYQRKIPLLAGNYGGFDVAADIQATVGIPVVHVFLIAFGIFYALLLADRYCRTGHKTYVWQYFSILALFFLNNSRGYLAFCVVGAMLVVLHYGVGPLIRHPALSLGIAIFAAILLIVGIGALGNIRTGLAWDDNSYIARIGLYSRELPVLVPDQVMWAYTYVTSPLANLNANVAVVTPSGDLAGTVIAFLPDFIGKYAVAERSEIAYQVAYLNASTGYSVPFSLGGGMQGLYLAYVMQAAILEIGGLVARRLKGAYVLYGACASIMTIVFVFFNTFSNSSTGFLLLFALATGVLRSKTSARNLGLDLTAELAPDYGKLQFK